MLICLFPLRRIRRPPGAVQSVPDQVLVRMEAALLEEALLAGALFGADFLPKNRRPPPKTGEHTSEILRSLGYSSDEIEAMHAKGAAR